MTVVEHAARGLLFRYRDSHTPHEHPSRPLFKARKLLKPKKPRESRKAKKERLASLATQPVPALFQANPYKTNRSLYPPKSYTENIEAFCETARKRRSAIIRNLRITGRHFSHLVTINLYEEHHPAIINRDFRELAKTLKRHGLNGHWTIEVNRSNCLHWHLLFLDFRGTPTHLKTLIAAFLKGMSFPRFRVEVEAVDEERYVLDYCLKVMKPGYWLVKDDSTWIGGRSTSVSDLYARKRILFAKGTGLDKHGTFGSFWAEGWNERKLRKQIQLEAARIEENLKDPRVRRLVEHIHITNSISLTTAKWAFALDPYEPATEALMRSLEAQERPTHPSHKATLAPRSEARKATRKSSNASWLVRAVFRRKTTLNGIAKRVTPPKPIHSVPKLRQEPSENSVFRMPPDLFDPRIPLGSSP